MSARALAPLVALAVLGGCASARPPDLAPYLPRVGAAPALLDGVAPAELEQLALIATNLVAALVQLPETSPSSVTLQVSAPASAFGSALVRALEDAGYGLQHVDADQGRHYVSYRSGTLATEAGPVSDHVLSVGDVRLQREYAFGPDGVFPASLLTLANSAATPADIVLDDDVFREQGGAERAFVSGVRDAESDEARVEEIAVNDYDAAPGARRTSGREVLEAARARRTLAVAEAGEGFDPDAFERTHRTVLIFEDGRTRRLGAGNKQAVRLLARGALAGDVFVVTACTAADGHDEAARARGARVVEEFLGHGLPSAAVRLAPCLRASYRHASDDSPVPVEVVQLRPRTAPR